MNRIISTEAAPAAVGPYSQGIEVPAGKKILFISGQIPIIPGEKTVIDAGIKE